MFNEVVKKIEFGGHTLELSTGKIARQSDGAVMVKMGDSIVLCTAVSAKEQKDDATFFPLTVHYREMAYAAGKIPGGFFKREGKVSEKEILVSRLIDRPIRPLFHHAFFNETQVICTVLSYDPEFNTDILSIIGSSAALALSGVPYQDVVAAARVGIIDEKFVLNPSFELLKQSKLDLVIAGTATSIMMVESEAKMLSEEIMLDALKFGHESLSPVIEMINDLVRMVGKPKWSIKELFPVTLKEKIKQLKAADIKQAFTISQKQERKKVFDDIDNDITTSINNDPNQQFSSLQIKLAIEEVKYEILRHDILENNVRIDGRKLNQIRPIDCMVGLLPKTHGSALFTRGETQGLVTVTLGTGQDEQIVDSLDGEYKEHIMLNYIFPPYSVGETTPLRAPSRRETGHGKLAWRAVNPVMPTKDEFPYSIRVVSEITESNGSSSMATVCGASMALMDAGVPIAIPVSGIAMGLIKEGSRYVILSDILGDEDYLGDMDFKVAGSINGITALQMDIKVNGITFDIMDKALSQAKEGRIHILQEMSKAISEPNNVISSNAPSIKTIKIDKNKIREVIGAGGKIIREICETTGAKIDIADDGVVSVAAVGQQKVDAAIARIQSIVLEPQVGGIFDGTVVKILEAGAFINYSGNKDGFVHISEISQTKIKSVDDVLHHGDIVKVKIIGFDNKGKAKLTIKNIDNCDNIESDNIKPQRKVERNERERDGQRKKWQKNSNNDEQGAIKERKYFS